MALSAPMVQMTHPSVAGSAYVTQEAFEAVWQAKGWVLVAPDAIINLPALMMWTGAWTSTEVYKAGDVVSYNGDGYVAKTVSQNITPTSSNTHWELVTTGTGPAPATPDATTTTKGKVMLAGDLAGTASAPTVPGLASKVATSEKGAANGVASLDGSGKVPTSQLPVGDVPDASVSVKGKIQLAGDLAGTAAAPTVPGLAGKASTTALANEISRAEAAEDAETAARQNADALLIPLAQKGAASGVAPLGVDSRVPYANLPPMVLGDTFTVASQAAMLALAATRGDVAIRTDLDPDATFLLLSDSPGTLADWQQITPPAAVLSVNGRMGAVTGLAEAFAAGSYLETHSATWVGNDATDNKAAIDATFASADSALVRAGTYRINSNLTITKHLWFERGAVLKPAAGVTVTINGQVSAGRYRIFDLSLGGLVRFGTGAVEAVAPEWWGAKSDNTVDCGPPTQAAIDSLPSTGGTVSFSAGVYPFPTAGRTDLWRGSNATTALLIGPVGVFGEAGAVPNRNFVRLKGSGMGSTTLMLNGTYTDGIRFSNATQGSVEHMTISCQGSMTNGLHITADPTNGSTQTFDVVRALVTKDGGTVSTLIGIGTDTNKDVSEITLISTTAQGLGGTSVGIKIGNGSVGNVTNVRAYSCVARLCATGIQLHGGGLVWAGGACSNNSSEDFLNTGGWTANPLLIMGSRSELSKRFIQFGHALSNSIVHLFDVNVQDFTDAAGIAIQGQLPQTLNMSSCRFVNGAATHVPSVIQWDGPIVATDVWTDNPNSPWQTSTGAPFPPSSLDTRGCGVISSGGTNELVDMKPKFNVNAREHGNYTVAYSATPVFDAANGKRQVITLTGNVTSSSITNASPFGHQLIIEVGQDPTGGRTFAWPTNITWNDGGPPVSLAPRGRVAVSLAYDGSGGWFETARSSNIGTFGKSDDFNRADSPSSIGGAWSATLGNVGIISNKAYMSSGSDAVALQDVGSRLVPIEAVVTCASSSSAFTGLAFAGTDTANFLYLGNSPSDGNGYRLFKRVAGVDTFLTAGFGSQFSGTKTMKVLMEPSGLVRAYQDGVEIFTNQLSGPDLAFFTGTLAGFRLADTADRVDDWRSVGVYPRVGRATLAAGTVTVPNSNVSATSRILVTVQSLGTVTTPKPVAVTARVAGSSFTITSADATDTSVVAYQIID